MNKKRIFKLIALPTIATSMTLTGMMPAFTEAPAVYAVTVYQKQLDEFTNHYAGYARELEKNHKDLLLGLEKVNDENIEQFVDSLDTYLTDLGEFLEANETYGNHFNADMVNIEAHFYDILVSIYNLDVSMYNYLIGEITEEEYLNELDSSEKDMLESNKLFKESVYNYQKKHNLTLNADLLYLLDEETTSTNTYTVKKGDTLYSIAKKHGVTVADIKKMNNLKSDSLKVGQKLIVEKGTTATPPKEEAKPVTKKTGKVTASSLNVRSGESTKHKVVGTVKKGNTVTVLSVNGKWAKISYGKVTGYVHTDYLKISTESETPSNPTAKTHTVQKGDTLYKISKKYNLSVNDLKKLNGMKNDSIKIGQKLKVSK